jgi:Zinc dependent phospholipase C
MIALMQIRSLLYKLCWLIPLLLQSNDVWAWGLMTHLYFAQSLLWAMPLLDPRLQAVIRKFPELVMAGACLPDLAIVSNSFHNTHDWEHAQHLLNSAQSEEETAIAIGYASHLYVDVIAHNHFVPAHEAMWLPDTMATHIASEWAMDAHLTELMDVSPGHLLSKHHHVLCAFIIPRFKCSRERAVEALKRLAFWDRVLRGFKIPQLIYISMRLVDKRVFKNFIYYIAKTQTAIADIGMVMQGIQPNWGAEQKGLSAEELIHRRKECLKHLDILHPSPITYFTAKNS